MNYFTVGRYLSSFENNFSFELISDKRENVERDGDLVVQSVDASALIGPVLRGSHVSSPYLLDTFISIVNLTQFRLSLLFCQLKKLKTTIWVICRAHYLVYSRSLFIRL